MTEAKKKYRAVWQITFSSGDVLPDQEVELTLKEAESLLAKGAIVPVETKGK